MKPFQMPTLTARIRFEDTEYFGAEVVVRRDVPLGQVLQYGEIDEANPDTYRGMYATFATFIMEWNLVGGDGEPVPVSEAGLLSMPIGFVLLLMRMWNDSLKVSGPLAEPSKDGAMSAAD